MNRLNKILFIVFILLIFAKIFTDYIGFELPVKKFEREISFVEPRRALINITLEKKQGTVVFDQAHQNSHSIYSDLSTFASYFAEAGYKIKTVEEKIEELSNVDVLVLVSPVVDYNESEKEVILSALRSGTTLIIFSDRKSAEVLNKISIDFGIIFNKDEVYDLYNYSVLYKNPIISEFSKNRITENVSEIVVYDACSLKVFNDAQNLASTSETGKSTSGLEGKIPIAAISNYYSGSIFAICDVDMFTNKNMKNFDNEIFIRNLINWT